VGRPLSSGKRPNYGIDAPGVVLTFAGISFACVLLALLGYFTLRDTHPIAAVSVWNLGLWPGLTFLVETAIMLWGSKVGKLRYRDRFLDALAWRGDERVLDVGCGHGLLLLGAAKRLTSGKAIGVDRWQREDQAGNRPAATWENADLEGVAERIAILGGDARSLPFADQSFDVVLSSWALHNIYDAQGRRQALGEVARVLRPEGRILLIDIRHTAAYLSVLREAGWTDVRRSGPSFLFITPTYAVTGRKPVHAG
jgi:SAM-dependent methyltransferase